MTIIKCKSCYDRSKKKSTGVPRVGTYVLDGACVTEEGAGIPQSGRLLHVAPDSGDRGAKTGDV